MMATGSAKQPMPSMTVMAAMMLPERGDRRDLAAADLGQHRGGPPDGLGHVAELVGLDVPSTAYMAAAAASRTPVKMMTQASSERRSAAIRRPSVASAGE